jgi:integrase
MKSIEKLTTLELRALDKPGRYSDGGNLYVVIGANGGRSWSFIYRWQGRTREAGLGAFPAVSLKDARALAKEGRELLSRKPPIDPLTVWRRSERERVPTFEEAARAYLDTKSKAWRNAKHRRQVAAMLERCKPLAHIPVDEIATADALKVVKPIFDRTPPTALRLRGHIESVLNTARAHGHIDADRANPARWRGHLELLLPKRKTAGARHFTAMPYKEIPAFVSDLRDLRRDAAGVFHVAAYALEFLILTSVRSGEVLGARWSEIDEEARTWALPAGRMKALREHVVPLSDGSMAILEAMRGISSSPLIFPGRSKLTPMAGKAFERILARMGRDVTTHGFRSGFRDWAGDETEFPREVAEAALAHAVGDATERAYRRGSALEKRRALMEAWSAFVTGAGPASNVVEFKPHKDALASH